MFWSENRIIHRKGAKTQRLRKDFDYPNGMLARCVLTFHCNGRPQAAAAGAPTLEVAKPSDDSHIFVWLLAQIHARLSHGQDAVRVGSEEG